MAEAALILTIIDGSLGLAIKCGQVAKALKDVSGKYKSVELDVKLLAQHVDTIRMAWQRIGDGTLACQKTAAEESVNIPLFSRLEQSLECGELVISALEDDLAELELNNFLDGTTDQLSDKSNENKNRISSFQKLKLLWNEASIESHRERVRDQSIAMLLLIQILNLPLPEETKTRLRESEAQLQQCDESAYSIVPSRLSKMSKTSTLSGRESVPMVYQPLSFDDDLFDARVYKRKYKDGKMAAMTTQELHQITNLSEKEQNQAKSSSWQSAVKRVGELHQHDKSKKEGPLRRLEVVERIYKACMEGNAEVVAHELKKHPETLRRLFRPFLAKMLNEIATRSFVSVMAAITANINDEDFWQCIGRESPLFIAAENGDLRMAQLLLEHKIPIDSQDSDGNYAIHYAVSAEAFDIVSLLLIEKSHIGWLNDEELSPLSKAIHLPHRGLVAQMLLSQGSQLSPAVYEDNLNTIRFRLSRQGVDSEPVLEELRRIQAILNAFLSPPSKDYNYQALAMIIASEEKQLIGTAI